MSLQHQSHRNEKELFCIWRVFKEKRSFLGHWDEDTKRYCQNTDLQHPLYCMVLRGGTATTSASPSSKLQTYIQTYPAVNYRVILASQVALWWQPPRSKITTHPGSSCARPAHLTRSVLSQIFYIKPIASATEIVIVTLRFLQLGIRCSRHQVAISLQD